MYEVDKRRLTITIGLSGWIFLLVPAHPGCPGQNPESHKRLCVCCSGRKPLGINGMDILRAVSITSVILTHPFCHPILPKCWKKKILKTNLKQVTWNTEENIYLHWQYTGQLTKVLGHHENVSILQLSSPTFSHSQVGHWSTQTAQLMGLHHWLSLADDQTCMPQIQDHDVHENSTYITSNQCFS